MPSQKVRGVRVYDIPKHCRVPVAARESPRAAIEAKCLWVQPWTFVLIAPLQKLDEVGDTQLPSLRLSRPVHVNLAAHHRKVARHIAMEWKSMRLIARHASVVPSKAWSRASAIEDAAAEGLLTSELGSQFLSFRASALDELHHIGWQVLMRRL